MRTHLGILAALPLERRVAHALHTCRGKELQYVVGMWLQAEELRKTGRQLQGELQGELPCLSCDTVKPSPPVMLPWCPGGLLPC